MTSASTTVNTSLLRQFIDCNRDVMPACVATSYPCINNEHYQREYRRDETGNLSEASSPDTPKYEDSYKSHIQCPQPLLYPEKLAEEVFSYTSKRRKYEPAINRAATPPQVKTKSRQDSCRDTSSSSSESSQNDSPKREHDRPRKEFKSDSPNRNHPLKKRILKDSENNKEDDKKESCLETFPNIAKSEDDNLKKLKISDSESSSEILRQMYASFEANFGSHFPGFNPFSKLSQRENPKIVSPESSPYSSQNYSHKSRLSTDKSPSVNQTEPNIPHQESTESKKHELTPSKHTSTFPKQKSTTTPLHNEKSKQKNSRSDESSKKRKFSADTYSSSNSGFTICQQGVKSPVQEVKRARYSSSESSDSQKRQEKDMSSFYKQNGSWYPFVNPLLYSSGAFPSFGMPGNGCNIPMSGYPHPNPLLFGSNPYLANSVMMRDMMNSSGMASLMPFFPNTSNFSGFPSQGVSPQQLQAFHQLQSAMLGQSSPLFSTNNYQCSPGILPFMQNPLLAANRPHFGNFSKVSPDKLLHSQRTPSPDRTSSKKLSEAKTPSHQATADSALPPFAKVSKRKHSSLVERERHFPKSYLGKLSTPDNVLKPKCYHKTCSSVNTRQEDASKSIPGFKYLTKNAKTLHSKKRNEKKMKETVKMKGGNQQPVATESRLPASANRNSPDIKTEDVVKNQSECSPSTGVPSPKGSSYKNLTRERRLVANARERTRVHTISSAFDELRAQIPSYSCNQKLSKLAILRIACEYIRTLSVLVGHDDCISFSQGVDQCTRVLQSESRARSRRKNNKAQIEMEMENYERHKSRDEEEPREEGPDLLSNYPAFSRASSPGNPVEDFPSKHPDLSSNSQISFADDVTETDHDIVDVESVDDENTAKGFNEFAQRNSSSTSGMNDSDSSIGKSQLPHSSPESCQSSSCQSTSPNTQPEDITVE